jgi:ATP-dependent RNA helicase DDX21
VDLIIQLQPPPDIDSYIHRSGRTGRAGKSGTCITLITKYEKQNLHKIEFVAKIKIKKIGVPQIQSIMKANARDISLGFDKVS